MRPLLVMVLGVVSLGTVWTYGRIATYLAPPPPSFEVELAEGNYTATITFSYSLPAGAENLLVRLNGETTLALESEIKANVPIRLEYLKVRAGSNIFFFAASGPKIDEVQKQTAAESFLLGDQTNESDPEKDDEAIHRFVRLQILRDGSPVSGGEQTIHLDSKSSIVGEIEFSAFQKTDSGHDHS